MKFIASGLGGAWIVEPEKIADHRGYFARIFCQQEFAVHGLETSFVQCNTSFNSKKGTLRGMHYQAEPYAEAKLVRCTRGALFDVIIDIRRDSPTYGQWFGLVLSADNSKMLYVPEGFAHGFQTLTDDSEVMYQMGQIYHADHACGIRWNDPGFAIRWPFTPPIISERDAECPDFAL